MKKYLLLIILAVSTLMASAQSSGGEIRRGKKPGSSTARKPQGGQRRSGTTPRRSSTSNKYLRVDGYSNDIYYNVSAEAQTYTYDVECSSDYEVSLLPTWCELVAKLPNYFLIRQDANPRSTERTDWFRVKATNGKQIDIHLIQAAGNVSVSGSGGGAGSSGYGYTGTTRTYTDVAKALPSLTKSMKEWGECKTGAIDETGSGVVIYGTNGYSFTGIPTSMSDKIKELNKNKKVIKDVALSGDSWWIIVYEKNSWYGVVPGSMKSTLEEYVGNGEEIWSVSVNSGGHFTIITDKHFHASHSSDKDVLTKAHDKYGLIYSACTTPKGLVVCCEKGCYYSNIPTNVETKIKGLSFIPKVVKFTDSGTMLITDGEKKEAHYM